MTDQLPAEYHAAPPAPLDFGNRLPAAHMNAGAIEIETQRAIAETKGQLFLAKQFPRDMHRARAEFLEACSSLAFAQKAFYSVPNRGAGPSIRFAEEAARCYGNFDYGHREQSRGNGKSEIEVYAWDKEKNNYSKRQITVQHIRDTKNGPQPLRDQTDIDNRIANIASKQMRGRILALMPKDLIAEGEAKAKETLATGGSNLTIAQRIAKMTTVFAKYGITVDLLEKYLKHKLDATTSDELVEMVGVITALKEGAKASDYFNFADDADTGAAAAITASAGVDAGKTDAPKAAAEKPAEKAAEKKQTAPKADAKKPAADKPAPAAQPAAEPAGSEAPSDEEELF